MQIVEFLNERVEDGTAHVTYGVMGWTVEMQSALNAPYNGADRVTFRIADESMESVVEGDGLTFDVIRAVPLADARKRLTALKRGHRAA